MDLVVDVGADDSGDELNGPIFRPLRDPLDYLDDTTLTRRYRLDRQSILWLVELLRPDIERPTGRSRAIPVHLQVLMWLDYLASNSLQSVIAQQHNVVQATVSRCLDCVTNAFLPHVGEFVKFPMTVDERRAAAVGFHDFPRDGSPRLSGIVGAIDGTHVLLEVPPGNDEADYVNRKGQHSINVQLICDANGKFLHCLANYPGSSHDAAVLRASDIWDGFENGKLQGR